MAIERTWVAIPAITFTANGTADGVVTVASVKGLHTKQRVNLQSNTQPQIQLEVKRVISKTQLIVGPIGQKLTAFTDISAYLAADSATISAPEQSRPSIPQTEHERAAYEEEPVVAKRAYLVDDFGNSFSPANPLPVQLSDGAVNIETLNQNLSVQLSAKDNYPNTGDIHDSVRIGDGKNEVFVNDDGSINVHTTSGPLPDLVYAENDTTITSAAPQQIFSYTSTSDNTSILSLECYCTTPATFVVKIDGVEKRKLMSSPLERNIKFIFENGRPLANTHIITIEAQVERFIWPTYGAFVSMEATVLA